jgi:hypothetical protein
MLTSKFFGDTRGYIPNVHAYVHDHKLFLHVPKSVPMRGSMTPREIQKKKMDQYLT